MNASALQLKSLLVCAVKFKQVFNTAVYWWWKAAACCESLFKVAQPHSACLSLEAAGTGRTRRRADRHKHLITETIVSTTVMLQFGEKLFCEVWGFLKSSHNIRYFSPGYRYCKCQTLSVLQSILYHVLAFRYKLHKLLFCWFVTLQRNSIYIYIIIFLQVNTFLQLVIDCQCSRFATGLWLEWNIW